MTPLDVINEVLDDLERPDLISVAERKFPQALTSSHAVDSFARDLKEEVYLTADFLVREGNCVSIVPPAGFRKVWAIFTSNGSGNIVDKRFYDQTGMQSLRDYFGYTIPKTFNRFGGKLNVTGISEDAKNLYLQYLSFPVIEVNASGEMVADSWILEEFPQLVVATLKAAVAPILQQEDVISHAQNNVFLLRREIISVYVDELLGEPETWPVR